MIGTNLERVQKLISQELNIDIDKVTQDAHLFDDLNFDSLDSVQVVLELENEFDIEILEKEISRMESKVIPGDIVFKLHDTFGFPFDLTADIAREQDLELDDLSLQLSDLASALGLERLRASGIEEDLGKTKDILNEAEDQISLHLATISNLTKKSNIQKITHQQK